MYEMSQDIVMRCCKTSTIECQQILRYNNFANSIQRNVRRVTQGFA